MKNICIFIRLQNSLNIDALRLIQLIDCQIMQFTYNRYEGKYCYYY